MARGRVLCPRVTAHGCVPKVNSRWAHCRMWFWLTVSRSLCGASGGRVVIVLCHGGTVDLDSSPSITRSSVTLANGTMRLDVASSLARFGNHSRTRRVDSCR